MKKTSLSTLTALMLVAGLSSAYGAAAPDSKAQYPSMAPLHLYLDDRDAEIALARSAAPDAISRDATVMVLTEHGYVTAVEGKNGFVCVVERAWMSPDNSPDFWNPKMRGPLCFNPPAARSILPSTLERTKMVLAGKSKDQIIAANKAAYENQVGFIGGFNGLLYFYLPEKFARIVTSHMLGMKESEVMTEGEEVVNDAIGELTNMTVGVFKNSLAIGPVLPPHDSFDPSGLEFTIEPISSANRYIFYFDCSGYRLVANILMKSGD